MKKTITIILAVAMILASAGCIYAANSYSQSPSVQDTPVISGIKIIADDGSLVDIEIVKQEDDLVAFYTNDGDGPAEDDCLVTLKLTPYAEKQTIENVVCKVTDGTGANGEVSAEDRLVYARTNPKNGTDGLWATNFKTWRDAIDKAASNGEAGAAAAKSRIQNKEIAIVSVFDVSVWCEKPEQHDVTKHHCMHKLRLEFGDSDMSSLLDNYVALMHFNRAGEWEYIPSTLIEDPATGKDVIEFSIDCDNLSPFAIAAYSAKAAGPTSPQTGETFPTVYVGGAVLFLGLAVFFFAKSRKETR